MTAAGFGSTAPGAIATLQAAGAELVGLPEGVQATASYLESVLPTVDAYIAGVEPLSARAIAAAARLRVIARRGVGYDAVDVAAATARGIPVTITAGAVDDGVADHTMALILAVARKIPAHDRALKSGRWTRMMGVELAGKTLGIIGFGGVGRAVARRAAGFGLRLIAFDVAPDAAAAAALGVTLTGIEALLAASDIVSLHVSLGRTSRGLIDATALQRMKPTAILVNTSRGGVIDEEALGRALEKGRLAGAGLDVFHEEPIRDPRLAAMESVVATPHVASNTAETVARMDQAAALAVAAVLRGDRPAHVVNPEVYDRAR